MRKRAGLLAFIIAAGAGVHTQTSGASEKRRLTINFAEPVGTIHALHGINKGPLVAGGLLDLTEAQRALRIPSLRLHDCHWPNPDVVDFHAIFPNLAADPESPQSYHFGATDEYLSGVRATGAAQVVFRLGESIEHSKTKRFVHPPPNAEAWAAICLGVIRHYNEGWAGGFHHKISYWEIWNEPDNRPAMWSGTDEDYFTLYAAAAKAIKSRYPLLKVGGPGAGHAGNWDADTLHPAPFTMKFLDFCRRHHVPLDFFSWHCYTDEPRELTGRAKAVRALLDEHGFSETESHLNEWNYLPGKSWEAVSTASTPAVKERFHEATTGAAGAAFITTALIELQDGAVDVCNLFHGEVGTFGLFNERGMPHATYHAMRAFSAMQDTPVRVQLKGTLPGKFAALAGLNRDGTAAAILLSNFLPEGISVEVVTENARGREATVTSLLRIPRDEDGGKRDLGQAIAHLTIELPAFGIAMVELRLNNEGLPSTP